MYLKDFIIYIINVYEIIQVLYLGQLDGTLRKRRNFQHRSIIVDILNHNEVNMCVSFPSNYNFIYFSYIQCLVAALADALETYNENKILDECDIIACTEVATTISWLLNELCKDDQHKSFVIAIPLLTRVIHRTLCWQFYASVLNHTTVGNTRSIVIINSEETIKVSLKLATAIFNIMTEFDESDTLVLISIANQLSRY